MREILFRGKRVDNSEWVEGSLIYSKASVGADKLAVIVESCEWDNTQEWYSIGKRARVIPETIGQFTGLTDKNGKKIFEGDILTGQSIFHDYKECFVCIFREGGFYFRGERSDNDYCLDNIVSGEIIGNIHDNPELLDYWKENKNVQ